MKQFAYALGLAALALMTACQEKESPAEGQATASLAYPVTQKEPTVERKFGLEVKEDYRWLEQDTSAQTAEWVEAQNRVTFDYLEDIPFRAAIRERLAQVWDFKKYNVPEMHGGAYYFKENDGLQNQDVVYMASSLDAERKRIFIDPNTLSEDGTVALSGLSFSDDGNYAAMSLSESGSDWRMVKVKDAGTGEMLEDVVENVKFSQISWWDEGFFYSAYPRATDGTEYSQKNENHTVYYHSLYTPQEEDMLVYADSENPSHNHVAEVFGEGKVLTISSSVGTSGNILKVEALDKPGTMQAVTTDFAYSSEPVGYANGRLYFRTNQGAQNWRLIAAPVTSPGEENWEEVVPEQEHYMAEVKMVGNKLFVDFLKDSQSVLVQYALDGTKEYELPLGQGTIRQLDEVGEDLMFMYTSFTDPGSIYRYNPSSQELTRWEGAKLGVDMDQFETKQVFYTSKDGTRVPMFIVHKKGLELDGSNPTYLYSYGGFNIPMTPRFRAAMLVWLEAGGVYAQPSLRGGSDYGEKWHKGGMLLNKQNVFDDFIWAAEYLIDEGYTSKEKLAIAGGSNGGLLVGACMTQRPDLFQVALPAVGVMDMLHYHQFTIGYAWAVEYGNPEEEVHYKNLLGYSPLHNLKEGVAYPATLVKTADHDDRVVPAHSFKFAARLQEVHAGNAPVLIRIESKAGHGAGKPTSKRIDDWADTFAFALYNMGVTPAL